MHTKLNAEKSDNVVLLEKTVAETPSECLERFRASKVAAGFAEFADMPMTYAGRLDPMASGVLLVLLGEECKNKEKYLGLDKEYEVEILFGVATDTGDMLGLIEKVNSSAPDFSKIESLEQFIGKFDQEYPAYSSKTVGGKQLHNLARAGELPDEMPTKQVEIYSITEIGRRTMTGAEIATDAITRVSKVAGDFRQEKVIEGWKLFAQNYSAIPFTIIKLNVSCSAGTYMRSLAEKIGADAGTGALAFSIHRTKIAGF